MRNYIFAWRYKRQLRRMWQGKKARSVPARTVDQTLIALRILDEAWGCSHV